MHPASDAIRGGCQAQAAFVSRPALGEFWGAGPDLLTLRVGLRSRMQAAGRTDVAPAQDGNQGPPHFRAASSSCRFGPRLVAFLFTGSVPATLRTASAGAAAGVSSAGAPWTILKTKVKPRSQHGADTNGSHHLAWTRPAR